MDYYPRVEEFAELLRTRLNERGALARLSERSGIASHVIGRWRDGEGRPTDTNLRKLAPALGGKVADRRALTNPQGAGATTIRHQTKDRT